jgi:hypothetical protein
MSATSAAPIVGMSVAAAPSRKTRMEADPARSGGAYPPVAIDVGALSWSSDGALRLWSAEGARLFH